MAQEDYQTDAADGKSPEFNEKHEFGSKVDLESVDFLELMLIKEKCSDEHQPPAKCATCHVSEEE